MEHHHSRTRAVRRIVLPSGRTIDVIHFGDADTRPLHVCPMCDSELVQPVAWMEAEDGRWDLTLECPNCGWTESGSYEHDQVDLLEAQLDEGLAEMISDLQQLARANMAGDIDRFVAALANDLVLPEDF
jgi:hypothetical protein